MPEKLSTLRRISESTPNKSRRNPTRPQTVLDQMRNWHRTYSAGRATVLQTNRNLASDDLLRPLELESHDHAFGTRPLDTAET
jgi:hypothetical protein